MKRKIMTLLLAAALVLIPAAAFADDAVTDTSPAELASVVEGMDGATVRFTGEVVSEALRADDDHVWLNVLGDGVAMGVYMSIEMAEQVTTFGDYRHNGDVIEVVGVYNEACDDHGGDMDVHALEVTLVESGSEREVEIGWWRGIVGVVSLLIAFVQSRRFRRMRNEVSA